MPIFYLWKIEKRERDSVGTNQDFKEDKVKILSLSNYHNTSSLCDQMPSEFSKSKYEFKKNFHVLIMTYTESKSRSKHNIRTSCISKYEKRERKKNVKNCWENLAYRKRYEISRSKIISLKLER